MKTLIAFLAIAFSCLQVQAQNIEGQIVASQFGSFQVPGIATGSLQFEPATCQVSGGGKNFAAFAVGVPIKIVDSNPALDEVQTPSSVNINQCSVSMGTTYIHATPFYLTSGTGGLQEALTNGPVKAGGPNTVILDAEWYTLVSPSNPATVIASVHGSTTLGLVDVTTSPYTYYTWGGSAYSQVAPPGDLPAATAAGQFPASVGAGTTYTARALVSGDIPNNAANTTGTAGGLTGTPTLPSGTAGVTQLTSPCDNSSKLATDQFVVSCAGNGVLPSAPGAGYAPVSIAAGVNGYQAQEIPISFGSYYDQYITQEVNNSNYTTLRVNFLNKIFFPEGFTGYKGVGESQVAWPSPIIPSPIGLSTSTAPTNPTGNTWTYTFATSQSGAGGNAWVGDSIVIGGYTATLPAVNGNNGTFVVTASTTTTVSVTNAAGTTLNTGTPVISQPDIDLCRNVSYSGSNYIAISYGNGTTAPGDNPAIWQGPIPNSGPISMWDCAAYTAAAYAEAQSTQTYVFSGGNTYYTQGFVEPPNLYAVNLFGVGIFGTTLIYNGTAATPVISRPHGGNNYTFLQIKGFDINGGGVASAILDLSQLNQSHLEDLQVHNIAPGSPYFIRTGVSGGDNFQMHADAIVVGGEEDSEVGSSGTFTANLTSGGVTSFTVNNGGSNYPAPSATSVYYVQLNGTKGGTSNLPCTVMPSGGMVPTIVSGAVTAISPPSSPGTGCSGTIDVQVFTYFPVTNAWLNNASDSTFDDITIYAGGAVPTETSGWGFWNGGGNVTFNHIHPSFIPNGIYTQNSSTHWTGTELDNVFNKGMRFVEAYADTASSVIGTQAYGDLVGRIVYDLGTGANVNIAASGSLCGGSNQIPSEWFVFMTPSGPINTTSDWSKWQGGTVTGNDTACGKTMGDYIGTLNVGTCNGCVAGGTPVVLNPGAAQTITQPTADAFSIQPTVAATSGSNTNSPEQCLNGLYWTGSASAADQWCWSVTEGSGSNPSSQLSINYAGSGTYPILSFNATQLNFIGTTTFFDQLTVSANAVFQGSDNTITSAGIPEFNEYVVTGAVPTITGCGTISAQSGGATAGTFTTSEAGTCAASFALPSAPHGWTCVVQDITEHVVTNIMTQSATSATSCTVTGTTAASDVLTFVATAW